MSLMCKCHVLLRNAFITAVIFMTDK